MIKRILLLITLAIFIIILAVFIQKPGFYVLNNKQNSKLTKDNLSTPYNSHYTKDSIGIYLINLKRSKDRLRTIKPLLEQLNMPYTIVQAVDGNFIPKEKINHLVDFNNYNKYLGHSPKLGTIGCSMSHFKVWKQFLESNNQFALVLEDDISFNPNLFRKIIGKSLRISELWDILSFDISHGGLPIKIKKIINKYSLNYYLFNISHAGAYLINRDAAYKQLKSSLPIKMPVDHYFLRSWEFDVKFAGIEPRIVYQTFGDSEINNVKDTKNIKVKKDKLQKFVFIIKTEIIRFIYNLKIILMEKWR
ncbi:glycosyltransferase family 25 protein [Rickettsiales endosymbiont of Trichoplax sp. H2]|uniref:glycosyltransferase family 25 protein n=1 Tax=Rickettsiales endosymbiont of Trichoplax sp. H2 TaxID=2021221 RepID=UPI0012B274EA|nr:glycosyltransferase family 25 protein [Rickettsiales endosymbiont of Trichoplax sp. H2]MSO13575.1 Procollagen galactosyltransferase 1 [Rickettsiales endosymbiont of Trichoplax sp. H2]